MTVHLLPKGNAGLFLCKSIGTWIHSVVLSLSRSMDQEMALVAAQQGMCVGSFSIWPALPSLEKNVRTGFGASLEVRQANRV
jgi:hypothetical protein